MIFVIGLWTFLRAVLFGSAAIAIENLALRHQLLVLQRSVARPRLSRWDRVFWVWLSRLWASWRSSLLIVQPATVLVWHRKGFYYGWYSNASRGNRKKAQHQAQEPAPEGTIEIPPPAVAPALKQRWGQLSKKVYEADPLLCPRCGGAMRILACIDQPEVLEKIVPPPGAVALCPPGPSQQRCGRADQ